MCLLPQIFLHRNFISEWQIYKTIHEVVFKYMFFLQVKNVHAYTYLNGKNISHIKIY